MSYSVSRSLVEAFYKAYAGHDANMVAEFLHDDVKWTISGPVDVLPFCGTRHGKAAVLDLIGRLFPSVFHVFSFVRDATLVDGDRVATLNRILAKNSEDGRVINYRFTHFLRFCDDKVIEYISIIDSFDAVEQVVGHALDVHDDRPVETTGNLLAI
jgi:ketosteroid isomerase-like protein